MIELVASSASRRESRQSCHHAGDGRDSNVSEPAGQLMRCCGARIHLHAGHPGVKMALLYRDKTAALPKEDRQNAENMCVDSRIVID